MVMSIRYALSLLTETPRLLARIKMMPWARRISGCSLCLYVRAGGIWTEQAKLIGFGRGGENDYFGHVSVTYSGDTAIVGAYEGRRPNGLNTGARLRVHPFGHGVDRRSQIVRFGRSRLKIGSVISISLEPGADRSCWWEPPTERVWSVPVRPTSSNDRAAPGRNGQAHRLRRVLPTIVWYCSVGLRWRYCELFRQLMTDNGSTIRARVRVHRVRWHLVATG